jgi:TetR/AcrR family transcriptional regulator
MSDNRSTILAAALELFAAHGYDGIGVQQIARAAGVTKPTLYHYFQSKRGLFEALLAAKSGPLLDGLRRASTYDGDIVQTVTRVAAFYFDYQSREPLFYRLMLAAWFLPPASEVHAAVDDLQGAQTARLAAMFEAATAHHGNMRGRSLQYAVSLRGVIDAYVGAALQGRIDLDDAATIYRIVHQYLHGIFS